MSKSIAVMDSGTCARCRMLHGESIMPPHGACTSPGGCRCTASAGGGEIDLETVDVGELEELFGDAVRESLL
jgi:hypothetical protein